MTLGESDPSRRALHFVAIGGAGMSGLALVWHELGARVTGSDRAETSYLRRLRAAGIDARVGHDAAAVPDDAEVVVSSAIAESNPELARARERGQRVIHRGELLAELCARKRLIAVAGAHGKTTTAGMLAWIVPEAAFLLGGELPGAGLAGEPANARWGKGEWVIAEADESDASFLELEPEVAVITNVELDHHARWSSRAELIDAFRSFAGRAGGLAMLADPSLDAVEGDQRSLRFDAQRPGPPLRLAVPGAHNLLNARAALAAIELAGLGSIDEHAARLESFPGIGRRQERKGSRNGAEIYDDYAHHPTEVAATLAALRELGPRRLIAVFQPHLYSRTKALASRFGSALAAADEIAVLDVYPAREEPVGELAGVSGLDIARAAADHAGGRAVWWLADADTAARALGPRLRERDLLVTIGAGDIFQLADRLVGDSDEVAVYPPTACLPSTERNPPRADAKRSISVEVFHDYPLARLTTIRAGGNAELFAKPGTEAELVELLAWANSAGLAVAVVGSGSNLLVADSGVSGLVLKLAGELVAIEREGTRLICGGGARVPSAAAKVAGWGLAGLEFGINIPGTVGGAVRMNANAYGGELAEVLEWVDVCEAAGVTRREPAALGFSYRGSALRSGEVVSRAAFGLTEADPASVKATLAEMRGKRREAQPSGIKTFGSTFKNPDDPRAEGRTAGQLLEAAGCQGLAVGGARLAAKHANFVENAGGASTADVLAVMAAGRRAVKERFGVALEPEVQILGEPEWPQGWSD